MPRRRLTNTEKKQEWWRKDRQAREEFCSSLNACKSLGHVLDLLRHPPRHEDPGHHYYRNLGFFILNWIIPDESTYDEKVVYISLIARLEAAGELDTETRQKLETDLRRAVQAQGP